MQAEPDRFVCDDCEVLQRYQELRPENRDAWELWGLMARRTVVDLHLASWLIDAATDAWSGADKVGLVERLDLIREIIDPPKPHGAHTHHRR